MSEQLLPNLLEFPHENWNEKPKSLPAAAPLHQITRRPTAAAVGAEVTEPDENILDSEFVE